MTTDINELKTQAARVARHHQQASIVQAIDDADSPHEIRSLVVCRCAPAGVDAAKVRAMHGYAAGAFGVLLAAVENIEAKGECSS